MNTLDGGIGLHTHRVFADIAPAFGIEPPEWTLAAVCTSTDPEIFYPPKGGSTREAKKVCGGCSVAAECLAYALANGERFGIWGGLSERDRRRIKGRKYPAGLAGSGRGGDFFCGQNGCPYRGATQHALKKHRTRHHSLAVA